VSKKESSLQWKYETLNRAYRNYLNCQLITCFTLEFQNTGGKIWMKMTEIQLKNKEISQSE